MYSSNYEGIWFIEGIPASARAIGKTQKELNGMLFQGQLKSLDDVKKKMVKEIRQQGGNALVDFKYGQKSSFWSSIFSWDDMTWYGSGTIAVVSEDFDDSGDQN